MYACMYVCMDTEQDTYPVSGHGVRLTESINGDLPSYTYIHMRRRFNIIWLNIWTVIRATYILRKVADPCMYVLRIYEMYVCMYVLRIYEISTNETL